MESIYSTRWKCSGVIAACLNAPPSIRPGAEHLCSNFHLFKTGCRSVHVLLETRHFSLRTIADLRALIDGLDWDVQARFLLSISRRVASCALHEQSKRSHLKCQPQLCLGGGGGHIGEHSLFLDQDLEHIRNHASCVPERVLLSNPKVHKPFVVGVVKGCTQVTGREHLPFSDFVGVLGVNPLAIVLEQELVGPRVSVDGNDIVGARAIHSDT
mmetsp:Transcript_4917/g.31449  ORF Transcript_4917/g.31449 Transcript_4917/m.31449 type:complete len:213 (+) Transcript_4917:243-881(+)